MYSNADVAVALSKRFVKFVNLIQRQFTPVYALALSRPESESLSLGDAPFLRCSPEEMNVCQRDKAAKLCLSDVRNPVWRTSDYGAAIWPLFAAWFAKDLRYCLEKRTTTYLESPHSIPIRDDFSIAFLVRRRLVCRVRWEKAFPGPRASYTRATLYHWLPQTVETVKRARVARMTNTHITR